MLRCRFSTAYSHPRRPHPPQHPYWVTGWSGSRSWVVSYADSVDQLLKVWPDAESLDVDEVTGYVFNDRFPRPDWFKEPTIAGVDEKPEADLQLQNKMLLEENENMRNDFRRLCEEAVELFTELKSDASDAAERFRRAATKLRKDEVH